MDGSRESPQQIRAKERVDLVLRAAQEIMAERGYGGLTLSAVSLKIYLMKTQLALLLLMLRVPALVTLLLLQKPQVNIRRKTRSQRKS